MVGSGQTPPSLLLVASLIVRIDIVMMAVGWLALMVSCNFSQPPHLPGSDVGLFVDLDGDASVNLLNNIEERKVHSVKGCRLMECCNQINANKSFRPFRFAALLGEKAAGARSTSFKHKDLSDHCISERLR